MPFRSFIYPFIFNRVDLRVDQDAPAVHARQLNEDGFIVDPLPKILQFFRLFQFAIIDQMITPFPEPFP